MIDYPTQLQVTFCGCSHWVWEPPLFLRIKLMNFLYYYLCNKTKSGWFNSYSSVNSLHIKSKSNRSACYIPFFFHDRFSLSHQTSALRSWIRTRDTSWLILSKETKPHIFIPISLGSLGRWETHTILILLDSDIQPLSI